MRLQAIKMKTQLNVFDIVISRINYYLGKLSRIIIVYPKNIKNWWMYYFARAHLIKKASLRFSDGSALVFKQKEDIKKIDFKIKVLRLGATAISNDMIKLRDGLRFKIGDMDNVGVLVENFLEDQYGFLNPKGKTVLDIGANIGDTAVYFSKRGACKVIAIEPFPHAYNIARKNLKINNIKNVVLLNSAIGGERSTVIIDTLFKNDAGTALRGFESGRKVDILTLGDIVQRFKLNDALLKMDCEGCEYDVILKSSYGTLRKFEKVVVECHNGSRSVEEKLKSAGFMVKKTLPKYSPDGNMYINLIFAKRTERSRDDSYYDAGAVG